MKELKKLLAGILIVSAMSAAPAFADDSSSEGGIAGFFHSLGNALSSLFHSLGARSAPSNNDNAASEPSQPSQDTPVGQATPQAVPTTVVRSSDFSSATQASGQVTQDSEATVSGSVPQGSRWLMVQIIKSGENGFTETAAANPESPLPVAYLTEGAGSYTINYFASNGAAYTDNAYKFVASAQVVNQDQRDVAFLLPSLEVQSDASPIASLARRLTQGLSSDRDKALAIHNWITEKITYDVPGVNNGTFTERPQDALSVLNSELAVCEGYADLYAALMRSIGIRTKIVLGKLVGQDDENKSSEQICQGASSTHAWNEAFIDNRWVVVDTTLDAGSEDWRTHKFKRTPDNRELFDPSPSYFALSHLKCSDEEQ